MNKNDDILEALRPSMAENPELWRFGLLSPQQLGQFARDRGVPLGRDAVESLWQSGLLRCDLLISDVDLEDSSLVFVCGENGRFQYCDKRRVVHPPDGYGGVFSVPGVGDIPGELFFHPFRIFVLYHISRVFRFVPMSTQYLQHPEGLCNLAKLHVEMLDTGTSAAIFAERLEHWNAIAELSIVLEPMSYGRVFREAAWPFAGIQSELAAALEAYDAAAAEVLTQVNIKEIEEARGELCRAAELLDPNKLVHVLLRLMAKHERLKLRGQLGGCMLFLCMAEVVRRAAEDLLQIELPEEDELGFGQWMDNARSLLYGTERILDAPPETQRDLLTSMGLDLGTKARCYVEGATELGALRSAVGEGSGIEFINLRGQVLEKRGRGLSFAEALENDRRSKVFSVVVLDEDRADHVRALKKAAAEDRFFGVFCISAPDFEFANFDAEEILEEWLRFVARDGDEAQAIPGGSTPPEGVGSSEEFNDYLRQHNLPLLEKSEAWGETLMAHALTHETLPDGHSREGEMRPVVRVAHNLMNARGAGYERSRAQFEVDPDTGNLIKKDR